MNFRKLYHYLFKCPTFWSRKPHFKCPVCGETYRCYWDGHDIEGLGINICEQCYQAHNRIMKKRLFLKIAQEDK